MALKLGCGRELTPVEPRYPRSLTKLLVLLAIAGCSKSDDATPLAAAPSTPAPPGSNAPATAADPWAAQPAPGSGEDPWSKPPPTAAPVAPPSQDGSGGASALAGSYQCQQIRYNTATRMSSYVSSALGVFEVAGDGSYRSASYPGKGAGRVRASEAAVGFEGGAYARSVGVSGTTQAGSFFIRFSGNLTDAPAPSMRFNDHMCYRK